jgi:putative ABC transport system ATP-binding protein/lipoprotein-releasing system ATP-binding protein
MITLNEVSKDYPIGKGNTVNAVRGVSLEVNNGEFVIIVGRSGSGKTTLLNLSAGLTRPTSGNVTIDGIDLWNLADKQQSYLRSQKFGFIFQFPSLLPTLTVQENVVLPTIFVSKQKGNQNGCQALELLEKVGLSDKLVAYPRQLSAGQQQRVVIARALINQPEVLLADEPTSNLDERTELEISGFISPAPFQLRDTIVVVSPAS